MDILLKDGDFETLSTNAKEFWSIVREVEKYVSERKFFPKFADSLADHVKLQRENPIYEPFLENTELALKQELCVTVLRQLCVLYWNVKNATPTHNPQVDKLVKGKAPANTPLGRAQRSVSNFNTKTNTCYNMIKKLEGVTDFRETLTTDDINTLEKIIKKSQRIYEDITIDPFWETSDRKIHNNAEQVQQTDFVDSFVKLFLSCGMKKKTAAEYTARICSTCDFRKPLKASYIRKRASM